MPKKKTCKHLQFYKECLNNFLQLPHSGLCECANNRLISKRILSKFTPTYTDIFTLYQEERLISIDIDSFWAAGTIAKDGYNIHKRERGFTPLRQTIVLFMAAYNNEL